jgi:hypothetical protein
MASIGILNFSWAGARDYSWLVVVPGIEYFHDHPHPEVHANYIDRHRYVDTNYVSSGGRERMMK